MLFHVAAVLRSCVSKCVAKKPQERSEKIRKLREPFLDHTYPKLYNIQSKHTYAAPGGRGWLFAEPYYYCTRPTAVHF